MSGADVEVEALSAPEEAASRLEVERTGNLQLVLLEYSRPIEALDMREGALKAETGGAPIPAADKTWISNVDDGASEWEAADELPGPLADFRFEAVTIQACLEGGGCLVDDPGAGKPTCRVPCPTPTPVDPPAPPEPPVLTPCPDRWVTTNGPLAETCSPYPMARTPSTCPLGRVQRLGASACEPLGAACPLDDFADGLPPSAVFVLAGAAAPGDGTRAAPYPSLATAVAMAPNGATIAVGKGRYTETSFNIDRAVRIVGACAEETILDVAGAASAFTITGSGVSLEELTIDASSGIFVETTGDATLVGIALDGFTSGVYVQGGAATIRGLQTDGMSQALRVFDGGTVTASDVSILDSVIGVQVWNGSSMSLEDVVIDDTTNAIDVVSSSSITVARGMVSRYNSVALRVDASTTDIEDFVIRDAGSAAGFGISAFGGSTLEADRVWIESVRTVAITAGTDATASFRDLVIHDTRPQTSTQGFGDAIRADEGATIRVERGAISESNTLAVLASNARSAVFLTDVDIADTLGRQSDGEGGNTLLAVESGEIIVERVRVARSRGFGAIVDMLGVMRGTDLEIVDTMPRNANGAFGRAIEVSEGGSVSLTRLRASRNLSSAIFVLDGGSDFTARHVRLEQTRESGCAEFSCQTATADGIVVQLGGRVDMEVFEVVDNDAFGLRVSTGDIRFADGRVAGNMVGVQVTALELDFEKLGVGVVIEDNVVPFTTFAE